MNSTAGKFPGVFRRMKRRRHMLHAAELLEREAEALRDCNTFAGKWQDASAQADYDDLVTTAAALRDSANG